MDVNKETVLGEDKKTVSKTGEKERDKKERKKVKKVKKEETRKGDTKLIVALVAVLVATVVFMIFVSVERKIVNEVEKKSVVVVKKDVPTGIILTQENIMNYFTTEERVASDLPKGAYVSTDSLLNKSLVRPISKKEVVTDGMFTEGTLYEGIEQPVEISIELSKIGQAVGGVLRAGDLVDIYAVISIDAGQRISEDVVKPGTPSVEEIVTLDIAGEITEQSENSTDSSLVYSVTGEYACKTLGENIRVTNAFTSGGMNTEDTEKDGSSQVVTVINVVVPKGVDKDIALALEEGTLRVSKVVEAIASDNNEEENLLQKEVQGQISDLEEVSTETVDAISDVVEVAEEGTESVAETGVATESTESASETEVTAESTESVKETQDVSEIEAVG